MIESKQKQFVINYY